MVSDHAPIDLLLQRAGACIVTQSMTPRRHPYRLLIAAPPLTMTACRNSLAGDVYDEYVLIRSWSVLNDIANRRIVLPH